MNWFLFIILCFGAVELALSLPLKENLGRLLVTNRKAYRLLRSSRISDHWKEKAMAAYARSTFKESSRLAIYLSILIAVIGGFVLLVNFLLEGFIEFILDWDKIVLSIVICYVYLKVRARSRTSAYSLPDRVLHYLALNFNALSEFSYDLDQKLYPVKSGTISQDRHVFIAGLARAGTTVLMRRFYGTGEYVSLTYRDMPFVLAPRLWRKFRDKFGKKNQLLMERAHKDGILVNADSPEALEEVFWRVFSGNQYINRDCLRPYNPDREVLSSFEKYVAALLTLDSHQHTKYLSKNNNNILRLPAIRKVFPNALILVPFREPVAHARSLQRQHNNILALSDGDAFVLRYMRWLVHHEFGPDHRPSCFDATGIAGDIESLDYWMKVWTTTYQWLANNAPAGSLFVCYEDLCNNPDTWENLRKIARLSDTHDDGDLFKIGAREEECSVAAELQENARSLYLQLQQKSREQFESALKKNS